MFYKFHLNHLLANRMNYPINNFILKDSKFIYITKKSKTTEKVTVGMATFIDIRHSPPVNGLVLRNVVSSAIYIISYAL